MTVTAALLVMMAALAAAQEPTLTPVEETRAWQARRNESLSDNSGWLALAGLFPLSDGQFSLGAGTTSASSPPRRVGRLTPAASCGRTRRTQRGHTVLDFNRAYKPPCAFTPFATCPLPPPGNRLDATVTAGERKWRDAQH